MHVLLPGAVQAHFYLFWTEDQQKKSERSRHVSRLWVFQQLAKRLCPSESYRDSVQGGTVGLKSYCTVVEHHRAGRKYMFWPRWTSYVGHRTVDIVRWTSYDGVYTMSMDIVRWDLTFICISLVRRVMKPTILPIPLLCNRVLRDRFLEINLFKYQAFMQRLQFQQYILEFVDHSRVFNFP